jgi:hypothetical protein
MGATLHNPLLSNQNDCATIGQVQGAGINTVRSCFEERRRALQMELGYLEKLRECRLIELGYIEEKLGVERTKKRVR